MLYKKLMQQTEEQMDLMRSKIRDLEFKLEQAAKATVVLAHGRTGPQVCLVATNDTDAQARVQKARNFIKTNKTRLQHHGIEMTIHEEVPVNFWYYTPDGSMF